MRIPAQGAFFAAFHQNARLGIGASMVLLKVLYGSVFGPHITEGAAFHMHIGLPSDGEATSGGFLEAIPSEFITELARRVCRDYFENECWTALAVPAFVSPRTAPTTSEAANAFRAIIRTHDLFV
jgi:hypothetical protein